MLGNMDVWPVSLSPGKGRNLTDLFAGTQDLRENIAGDPDGVAQAQASPCPLPKHRSTITGCASIITGPLCSW